MGEGELKVLGAWPSGYVIRVRMMLEQKGISYEYFEEDFSNKSELLLKHNPILKKVPVLIHGDRGISESLVILQYIDENWPATGPPVLPSDPYERAMARFWAQYVDQQLVPSFFGVLKAASEEEKSEKIAETLAGLELLEGAFKESSGGKDFFNGDSAGFLDVTFGSLLAWIKTAEKISGAKLFDETKTPLLVQWVNRFLELDFVKSVLPSVERVEEFARNLQATIWKLIPAFIGILKAATEAEKAEKIADTLAALELLEGAFKKCSGGKDFIDGDSVGFLDVTLGLLWIWIRGAELISGAKLFDETKVPLPVQWVNRFIELDFVKSVLPSIERVEAYGRALQATRWKAASAK